MSANRVLFLDKELIPQINNLTDNQVQDLISEAGMVKETRQEEGTWEVD